MKTMQPIARFDLAFSLLCLQHRFNLPVARVSKAVSHTGDGHLYAVIGLLSWWFEPRAGQAFLMVGLLAFLIELPIYWLVKNSFKRRRPAQISHLLTSYITPSDQYSLPSGHTAAAFLMAVLMDHFYPDLGVACFAWAGLIGFSRILLGVHFLTDIVLGALLGVSCALSAIYLMAG
ncbi:phosphatase PAP2 family protein [Vibrio aphrogenes]|uniref:phosphatase PAP2 family protein n=1 Tax=Vibrio aphrogenes TaxID=1891186 RepID=UPI000B34ECB7|nr:phosphatase PAP2 family protein [Vibrio aphrogenes]